MKKLPCILLALSIFSLNALPVNATKKKVKTNKVKKQLVAPPGQWCFELPWMGLHCYKL